MHATYKDLPLRAWIAVDASVAIGGAMAVRWIVEYDRQVLSSVGLSALLVLFLTIYLGYHAYRV